MSNSSLPRRAVLVAACIGATAAVGTAPAFAAVPGENIFGSGSSLQKIAQQQIWTPTWQSTPADHGSLSNAPSATYTSSSSGDGLDEFGDDTGVLNLAQDVTADNGSTNGYGTPVLDAYVGSDDPPTSTFLKNASAAATGTGATINQVTVPVAQAPVTVMLSLPTGITAGPSTKVKLTNAELQSIWNANVPASTDYAAKTWGALLEGAGLTKVTSDPAANQFADAGGATGGGEKIRLQVRSSASGTTYTFKGFLNLSGDPLYPAGYVNDNDQWPVTKDAQGNTGGSQEVADTTADAGSVGYANLADAAKGTPGYTNTLTTTTTGGTHQIAYALMQDNKGGTGTQYADPQGNAVGSANVYTGNDIDVNQDNSSFVGHWTVPLSGGTDIPTGTWGGTQASDPDVYDHDVSGGRKTVYYPIVAVTYDLAWTHYAQSGSNLVSEYGGSTADATAAAHTASSLITYITRSGQGDLVNDHLYYARLPLTIVGYSHTATAAITP